MKVVVGTNEEISRLIAEEFVKQVNAKPNSVLGLATGTSPLQVYANLIKANKEGRVSFKNVSTFNLDEYIGLEGTHNQSYRYFMNENLFNHIDINIDNTHVLKGVGDYLAYANQYDELIRQAGGIDLQILGIGSDGHIAFNEPGTPFDSLTHVAELAQSTIVDNSRLFNDISEVPTKAVTMGLKSIMNARKIVLIATGKNKAQAIYNLLRGPKTEEVPCSILQDHKDCTIYVDEAAYSLVK
jgi:glucosamine-6-phosphate deaminase